MLTLFPLTPLYWLQVESCPKARQDAPQSASGHVPGFRVTWTARMPQRVQQASKMAFSLGGSFGCDKLRFDG